MNQFTTLALFLIPLFAHSANRPDLAIKKQLAIACSEKGESLSTPKHDKVCAQLARDYNSLTILFGPEEVVLLDFFGDSFGSTMDWCHREISDGHSSPSCILQVSEWGGGEVLNLSIWFAKRNVVVANINALKVGVKYRVQLLERGSGATSRPFIFERNN